MLFVCSLEAKNVLIKGGEWKLGVDVEPKPFQIVQVAKIHKHPQYFTGSLQNDFAVLVLSEKLRLNLNHIFIIVYIIRRQSPLFQQAIRPFKSYIIFYYVYISGGF